VDIATGNPPQQP